MEPDDFLSNVASSSRNFLREFRAETNGFFDLMLLKDLKSSTSADLKLSLKDFQHKYQKNVKMIENVEKLKRRIILGIGLIEDFPIERLIVCAEKVLALSSAVDYFPNFPPLPSLSIREFYVKTSGKHMSNEEIAEHLSLLPASEQIEALRGWKTEVGAFLRNIQKFSEETKMSEAQSKRVFAIRERVVQLMKQIGEKIVERTTEKEDDSEEWKGFYLVMSESFLSTPQPERKKLIRKLYEETDERVRRQLASGHMKKDENDGLETILNGKIVAKRGRPKKISSDVSGNEKTKFQKPVEKRENSEKEDPEKRIRKKPKWLDE